MILFLFNREIERQAHSRGKGWEEEEPWEVGNKGLDLRLKDQVKITACITTSYLSQMFHIQNPLKELTIRSIRIITIYVIL